MRFFLKIRHSSCNIESIVHLLGNGRSEEQKMVIGIVIGLVIGCSIGVFVAALLIGAKGADKQMERNADYLRAYHLRKAKSRRESTYIETEQAASKS
jgi:hypothetical protein